MTIMTLVALSKNDDSKNDDSTQLILAMIAQEITIPTNQQRRCHANSRQDSNMAISAINTVAMMPYNL